MEMRLKAVPGTPLRTRVRGSEKVGDKLQIPRSDLDEVVPVTALVEVAAGRSSGASTLRAARVRQELEEVGAAGRAELSGGRVTIRVEADRRQLEHAAALPFVRKIGSD